MGVGGALCALIAAGVSLTLLPALLGMLGERVNAGGPRRWKEAIAREARAERSGFWYRHSQRVMRRPVAGRGRRGGAADRPRPAVHDDQFTGIDASVLPSDQSARIVDDAIKTEFPPSETSPVYIALDPARRRGCARTRRGCRRRSRRRGSRRARIDLIAPGPPLSDEAKAFVREVRAVPAPFERESAARRPGFLDQQASLRAHLPLALAILAATTLIILFFMTRSVVLPVKALVMNLLSLCAAFGLLVLVFQDGHLEWLLRLHEPGRDRVLAARAAVRGRVRPLDRLRRVPARAHQGAARRRPLQRGGGRARAAAHGPDRDLRRAADGDRDRLLRDRADHLHQAARVRRGGGGADRRDDRPRAARARP